MSEKLPTDLRLQMIWQTVQAIPPGRVATYGDVARAAGLPGLSRFVGYALRQLAADTQIPWHRVINSQGRISLPAGSEGFQEQSQRLLAEGIPVHQGRIELRRFRHHFG